MVVIGDPIFLGTLAVILLITGVIAGVLAGLLGVGGGIVIVPVLYHLFALLDIDAAVRMHLAVGTSLATIIPTALSSARSHARRGALDHDLLASWRVWVFLGALLGTLIAGRVEAQTLSALFGGVALLVSAQMAVGMEERAYFKALPGAPLRQTIGTIIGAISAMMGIGGGTLSVPVLSLHGYPIHRAVGSASALGLIIALPGTVGYMASGWAKAGLPPLSLGYVNILGVVLIASATFLSAPLGARLAHLLNPRMLRRAFALFLGVTSVKMLSAAFF